MSRPRVRALVLTAGYGTRLRPLTSFVPKPLLPICGVSVAGHTLRQLAVSGCEVAVLNLHHLAEEVSAHFGRSFWGMPLIYSREEQILGTLGALYPPRQVLSGADVVLLVNGDTLSRWPFRKLIRRHLRSGADATLLLHRRTPDQGLGGGIGVDKKGRIVKMRDAEAVGHVVRQHVFAGVHVLSPRLLEPLVEGPGDIIADLYLPLLRRGGLIQGVVTGRPWYDLGTPSRYLSAHLEWRCGCRFARRRSSISPVATVDPSAAVQRSLVEAEAEISEGANVEASVILAGARVGAGCRVEGSILGPGVRLPDATHIERRMINRIPTGHQTSSQESRLGELIYTPL